MTIVKTIQISASIALATLFLAQSASQAYAQNTKPLLRAGGNLEASNSRARRSADRQWSIVATQLYGQRFANFARAKNKRYKCRKISISSNGENKVCVVFARPFSQQIYCATRTLVATGQAGSTRELALQKAFGLWSAKATQQYGPGFSNFGRSKNQKTHIVVSGPRRFVGWVRGRPCPR